MKSISVLFRMFDFDRDGMLSKAEIFSLVDICVRMQYQFSGFLQSPSTPVSARRMQSFLDSPSVIDNIMNSFDPDQVNHHPKYLVIKFNTIHSLLQDSFVQLDDFLIWAESSTVLDVFCDLLEQICHVVFGLKPISPEHEGVILKLVEKRAKWFRSLNKLSLQEVH